MSLAKILFTFGSTQFRKEYIAPISALCTRCTCDPKFWNRL